jgi:hypothetical protein
MQILIQKVDTWLYKSSGSEFSNQCLFKHSPYFMGKLVSTCTNFLYAETFLNRKSYRKCGYQTATLVSTTHCINKITVSTCYPFKVISTGSTVSYILLFHASLPILKASLPHHFVRMLYSKSALLLFIFSVDGKIHSSEQSVKFWEQKYL